MLNICSNRFNRNFNGEKYAFLPLMYAKFQYEFSTVRYLVSRTLLRAMYLVSEIDNFNRNSIY